MIRITSAGHAAFALAMIALGMLGLIHGDFASVWQAVPDDVPARKMLAYLCAAISLAAGLGLLVQVTAKVAVRVLLVYLVLWLLLLKVPDVLRTPAIEATWLGCGEMAVLLAGAWTLAARFALSDKGVRLAGLLFGVALIPLGLAHLFYVKETAALVPAWLPMHEAWAMATGCTYLLAALAVLSQVRARLAAGLSAVQMGGFTLLVWVPMVAAEGANAFQWTGLFISFALAAGAWVVADSIPHKSSP